MFLVLAVFHDKMPEANDYKNGGLETPTFDRGVVSLLPHGEAAQQGKSIW